ncbi:MAG: N(4)-(beta-N-acetylglucosaminyl)-L-asparaginase [Acidobacteria bacterium]|nr:N(4)-(beta-N-acetylglucosaminyl)-L-asparaginase [Acidobacteriota bacterium]
MSLSRRGFISSALAASVSPKFCHLEIDQAFAAEEKGHSPTPAKTPIVISAGNGYNYLDEAYELLRAGGDTLDSVLKVVTGPENDPNDQSVGLGGRPNEEGVVELDACCMHGPTRSAGAVGGVRNIKNVSLLANVVRQHTGHVMLVGEGAERFAVAEGFRRENLLTEAGRKEWLLWKETHSDWWGPGLSSPSWRSRLGARRQSEDWSERLRRIEEAAVNLGISPELRSSAIRSVIFPPTGTIHCSALNTNGELSGCTTTSGLAWKIPGRVGDSPLIGAGCYTDQDIGSAGATGSGEENIKVSGAHTIIENLRHGLSPLEAAMDALKRIVRNYSADRDRLKYVDMVYYVLRKDGAYAGVSLWEGYGSAREKPHQIAVHDGRKRLEKTVSLFPGPSHDWPPIFSP